MLLGMVEARSVNVKEHTHTQAGLGGYVQFNRYTHTHTHIVISIIYPLIPLRRMNASGMEWQG